MGSCQISPALEHLWSIPEFWFVFHITWNGRFLLGPGFPAVVCPALRDGVTFPSSLPWISERRVPNGSFSGDNKNLRLVMGTTLLTNGQWIRPLLLGSLTFLPAGPRLGVQWNHVVAGSISFPTNGFRCLLISARLGGFTLEGTAGFTGADFKYLQGLKMCSFVHGATLQNLGRFIVAWLQLLAHTSVL